MFHPKPLTAVSVTKLKPKATNKQKTFLKTEGGLFFRPLAGKNEETSLHS